MNREEAIKTLKENMCNICSYFAKDMESCNIAYCDNRAAIRVLEQEPCEMTAEEYRQNLIQVFHNADCDELIAFCVLPEEKGFKHLEWLLKNHYRKQEPCEEWLTKNYYKQESSEDLPSVVNASKKGKWINTEEISTNRRGQIVHEVICSECNGISYFRGIGGKYIGANFCPNCGAEMEGIEFD